MKLAHLLFTVPALLAAAALNPAWAQGAWRTGPVRHPVAGRSGHQQTLRRRVGQRPRGHPRVGERPPAGAPAARPEPPAAGVGAFSNPVYLLANVAVDKATRDAAQQCIEKLSPLSTELYQSVPLFQRVQALKPVDGIDRRYREELLENFEDSGASLSGRQTCACQGHQRRARRAGPGLPEGRQRRPDDRDADGGRGRRPARRLAGRAQARCRGPAGAGHELPDGGALHEQRQLGRRAPQGVDGLPEPGWHGQPRASGQGPEAALRAGATARFPRLRHARIEAPHGRDTEGGARLSHRGA